ncbi:MAG: hypothetical protein E6579_11595 [Clostridium sp.]|nr:hypothetical protein [Clostridium sp.]
MGAQYSDEKKTSGQVRTVRIDRSRDDLKKMDELGEKALKSTEFMDLVVNGGTLMGVNKDTLRGIIRVILTGAAAEVSRLTVERDAAIALHKDCAAELNQVRKALRLSIENHSTDHCMVERLISYYIQQAGIAVETAYK